jgi:hypothetical protein
MYLWSEEWIGEGGAEKEMAECVAVPRNLKHEMFIGRLMGKAYYFLIEKRFVVLSRLKNKPPRTEKKWDS